jgi:hypothetical protein
MSTQAHIMFMNGGSNVAIIRRNTDGYPEGSEGVLAGFKKFFDHLDEVATTPTPGQMYARVEWLSAEYVHWCLSNGQRCMIERTLEEADTSHLYIVRGGQPDDRGRPLIQWTG